MSKYDIIKTAADLVSEIQLHGLSTAQDDICRAQDIFGNSSVEELARLANDIGRNNDDGEPDPKGSWSSNRKPTQGTFYSIIFAIWNWEDACRFWNEYTNPLKEHHEKICAENRSLRDERERLVVRLAGNLYNGGFWDGSPVDLASELDDQCFQLCLTALWMRRSRVFFDSERGIVA